MQKFKINSNFKPAGDQPKAIDELATGLKNNVKNQMLLGITGSGKTFTMANVIERMGRPALVMAHNKTLAGQLYSELKELFPGNAVEYFVSYYDYYQPEAYVARTDTFIEKDASINEQIDLLRHSATRSLLERRDVIVVSSVSCIYGLGSPDLYYQMTLRLSKGENYKQKYIIDELIKLQYTRNDVSFERGVFRIRGENIDIFPSHYAEKAWRLEFFGDELENITEFDPLTGEALAQLDSAVIYANSHFVTPKDVIQRASGQIEEDLRLRLAELKEQNKLLEAQRLDQRTQYDLEMLLETGSCKGIENYSRYFTHKKPGEAPPTLFEYLPADAILFIDESHVTVPQIRAMYSGDYSRKRVLVDHGFRLPSAMDNRPLKFEEWQEYRPQTIFISATPADFEIKESDSKITEQIIRPTGLLDPEIIVRPATGQVDDLIAEINDTVKRGYRVLVTTLTKKMSEDLTSYLQELNHKVSYLHSEVHTLERLEIISDLRKGEVDVLVGINLLREGIDIPECALVAILDADKEGFLRSEVSLIQTIGRAARNSEGRVILYGDRVTRSMETAIKETQRRRDIQITHNKEHNIKPKTIDRKIHAIIDLEKAKEFEKKSGKDDLPSDPAKIQKIITKLKKDMITHADNLEFEKAGELRDEIKRLQNIINL